MNGYKKTKVVPISINIDNDGVFWAFDRVSQAVINFDKDFMRFNYIRGFMADYEGVGWAPINTYLKDDCLWISSVTHPDILIYDIEADRFKMVTNPFFKEGRITYFYDTVLYDDKIIILSRTFSQKSFIFDIRTEIFEEFNLIKKNDELFGKAYSYYQIAEEKIFLVVAETNKILKYNLKDILHRNIEYEIIVVAEDIKGVCAYIKDDAIFLSSHGDPDIHVFDSKGNHMIVKGRREDEVDIDYFCEIFEINNYLVGLPRHGKNVLLHDTSSDSTHFVKLPLIDDFYGVLPYGSFCHEHLYSEKENALYFLPWEYEHIVRIDMNSYDVEAFDSMITKEGYLQRLSELYGLKMKNSEQKDVWHEGEYGVDIEDYMLMVNNSLL